MQLKFLSESQNSILLGHRVIGEFDSELRVEVNGVRQSHILAEGLALLCFFGHCENVLAHFVQGQTTWELIRRRLSGRMHPIKVDTDHDFAILLALQL
ncbi:hypothetical protein PS903_02123 [Pseudomonas fluorescens]|nr:hypothetical protein PS903_02123 [Pseudomonas fluorescens]